MWRMYCQRAVKAYSESNLRDPITSTNDSITKDHQVRLGLHCKARWDRHPRSTFRLTMEMEAVLHTVPQIVLRSDNQLTIGSRSTTKVHLRTSKHRHESIHSLKLFLITRPYHTCHHSHIFSGLATKTVQWNGEPRLACSNIWHPSSKTAVNLLSWTRWSREKWLSG